MSKTLQEIKDGSDTSSFLAEKSCGRGDIWYVKTKTVAKLLSFSVYFRNLFSLKTSLLTGFSQPMLTTEQLF